MSSSECTVVFTIKSKEICDLLREYGFKIEDIYGENPKDTISSNGTIIYPNGEELCVELAGTDELFCCVPKDTVFEWLIEFIGASHLWDKLKKDGKDIVKLKSDLEKSIKECSIKAGYIITDGEGSFCTNINIKDGKKRTALLTDEMWLEDPDHDLVLGCELDELTRLMMLEAFKDKLIIGPDEFADLYADFAEQHGKITTVEL